MPHYGTYLNFPTSVYLYNNSSKFSRRYFTLFFRSIHPALKITTHLLRHILNLELPLAVLERRAGLERRVAEEPVDHPESQRQRITVPSDDHRAILLQYILHNDVPVGALAFVQMRALNHRRPGCETRAGDDDVAVATATSATEWPSRRAALGL